MQPRARSLSRLSLPVRPSLALGGCRSRSVIADSCRKGEGHGGKSVSSARRWPFWRWWDSWPSLTSWGEASWGENGRLKTPRTCGRWWVSGWRRSMGSKKSPAARGRGPARGAPGGDGEFERIGDHIPKRRCPASTAWFWRHPSCRRKRATVSRRDRRAALSALKAWALWISRK